MSSTTNHDGRAWRPRPRLPHWHRHSRESSEPPCPREDLRPGQHASRLITLHGVGISDTIRGARKSPCPSEKPKSVMS